MKKLPCFLSALLISIAAHPQSCLPEGITFTTQSQIDSFQVQYPNCTDIEGHVFIGQWGDDITNLDSLICLTSIGGSLFMDAEDNLISLEGLNNLTTIGGMLSIENKSVLSDLSGLNSLTTIGGTLRLYFNHALITLDGLNNLTSIGGNLYIRHNNSLISTTGLENLIEVGGTVAVSSMALTDLTGFSGLINIGVGFSLSGNNSLPDLSGLDKLETVGGQLAIGLTLDMGGGNSVLTDISSLASLNTIGGSLKITNNPNLPNLSGLDYITPGSITDVQINNNNSLSMCAVESLCNYLASPNGVIDIYNNAEGCCSPAEISHECNNSPVCLPFGNYYFFNQLDIDNFPIDYPDCTELEGNVRISGSASNLNGLNQITAIRGNLQIFDNDSLSELSGLNNLTSVGGSVILSTNKRLKGLIALENLESTGKNLIIHLNDSLSSLSGLEGLSSVGVQLKIHNNSTLENIDGIANIDVETFTFLDITNNPLLSNCAVESICNYLMMAPYPHFYTISDNETGCNNANQILSNCNVLVEREIHEENTIRIYPNPASGRIIIEITDTSSNNLVTIFNPGGQKVRQFQITETITILDILDLPAGVYFVRMTGDHSVHTSRLIKTTKH
ncbi:MAG: T9SS type A sorting domain-containing protein [Bacteroidales bacterium]